MLARNPAKAATLNPPFRLITGLRQLPDDTHIDAIVNLAGEPIANGLWTAAKRHRILASRLRMTGDVVRLIERLDAQAGRAGQRARRSAGTALAGRRDADRSPRRHGRASATRSAKTGSARRVQAERFGVRVVRLRIGLVLGTEGGMLARLLTPFEFGLGGPIGSGQQWMSWIERDDLVRLIAHAIATPDAHRRGERDRARAGAQRDLHARAWRARCIARRSCGCRPRRCGCSAGDLADELLLGGQRVVPQKALKSGFVFRHATSARRARRDPRVCNHWPTRQTPPREANSALRHAGM